MTDYAEALVGFESELSRAVARANDAGLTDADCVKELRRFADELEKDDQ